MKVPGVGGGWVVLRLLTFHPTEYVEESALPFYSNSMVREESATIIATAWPGGQLSSSSNYDNGTENNGVEVPYSLPLPSTLPDLFSIFPHDQHTRHICL